MGIIWLIVTKYIEITGKVPALGKRVIIHLAFLHVEDVDFIYTDKALNLQLFGDREFCLPHAVDVGDRYLEKFVIINIV